ncbi:hypothetical protein PGB90_009278 [Kerria lacca]
MFVVTKYFKGNPKIFNIKSYFHDIYLFTHSYNKRKFFKLKKKKKKTNSFIFTK